MGLNSAFKGLNASLINSSGQTEETKKNSYWNHSI